MLITMLMFELTKFPYILRAFSTGEYFLVPQFALPESIPSKSPAGWILVHWFIGNFTLTHAIMRCTDVPNRIGDYWYLASHFLLMCTIIVNITVFGTAPPQVAFFINFPFIVLIMFVIMKFQEKKWIRQLDIYAMSLPVLANIISFVNYTIQMQKTEFLVLYALLMYIALK